MNEVSDDSAFINTLIKYSLMSSNAKLVLIANNCPAIRHTELKCFRLAKCYKNSEGVYIPYIDGNDLTGAAARYASIATHKGIE
jgi:ribosomal protein L30E